MLTVPHALVDAVLADMFLHFLDLKENKSGRRIAVSMVADEESDRLLLSTIRHEEARGLREEEH